MALGSIQCGGQPSGSHHRQGPLQRWSHRPSMVLLHQPGRLRDQSHRCQHTSHTVAHHLHAEPTSIAQDSNLVSDCSSQGPCSSAARHQCTSGTMIAPCSVL